MDGRGFELFGAQKLAKRALLAAKRGEPGSREGVNVYQLLYNMNPQALR